MKLRMALAKVLTVTAIGGMMVAPLTASADMWHSRSQQHRDQQKNQWKNIGIGSAAVGVLGLLTHNNALTIGGLAGAGYSAYRYGQDHNGNNRYSDRYSQYERDRSNGWNSRPTRYSRSNDRYSNSYSDRGHNRG